MKKDLLLLIIFFTCEISLAQTSIAEKLGYLKSSIRIWVLHQPNVDSPSFYRVRPSGVYLDTDGIIMGKKSNNRMDNSAKLLSALFKDSEKKTEWR